MEKLTKIVRGIIFFTAFILFIRFLPVLVHLIVSREWTSKIPFEGWCAISIIVGITGLVFCSRDT